jgi:hypothetical protein
MTRNPNSVDVDYASHRVDSDHEEFPKNGRTWCDVCGWVDKLTPDSMVVALWHGDSFGRETRPIDDEDVRPYVKPRRTQPSK